MHGRELGQGMLDSERVCVFYTVYIVDVVGAGGTFSAPVATRRPRHTASVRDDRLAIELRCSTPLSTPCLNTMVIRWLRKHGNATLAVATLHFAVPL